MQPVIDEPSLDGKTHLIYIDESMQGNHIVIAALAIPVSTWNDCLDHLISLRRKLRNEYGVFISKELHTSEFLGGRGRYSKRRHTKEERAAIYKLTLKELSKLPEMKLFTVHCDHKKLDWGFERLVNRLQRNVASENGSFVIVADKGFEWVYTAQSRKMRRYNPIPSRYSGYRSLPLKRLIEDPFHLDSKRSYFIQAADAVAYSLLRFVTPKTVDPYGINASFEENFELVCVRDASPHRLGIIEVS